jgi:hypothetical protein
MCGSICLACYVGLVGGSRQRVEEEKGSVTVTSKKREGTKRSVRKRAIRETRMRKQARLIRRGSVLFID